MTHAPIVNKVCVLMGGSGSEAEVSRRTAQAVIKALDTLNILYIPLEHTENYISQIQQLGVDFTFIAMHGTLGEDGTVQAELESIHMPYNGSGVDASALAMNKQMAKEAMQKAGVDVARAQLFKAGDLPDDAQAFNIPMPFVVKPNAEGSSVGVFIVRSEDDYTQAHQYFLKTKQDVLVEEFIPGKEMTVGLMGERILCTTEIIEKAGEFYDYASKYETEGSTHICPAKIATDVQQKIENFALLAHKSLGCAGISRVDFRYDDTNNRIVALEVNTLPGFTPTSLLPEMAEACGISFCDLVHWSIKEGLCRTDYTASKSSNEVAQNA